MEDNVTPTPDAKDVADNKLMAILAYICFLIPLFVAKESPFARFHTNQGLLLAITGIAISIVVSILTFIPIIGFVGFLLPIVTFVLMVLGIINANNGQMKELPVIGKYRIIK